MANSYMGKKKKLIQKHVPNLPQFPPKKIINFFSWKSTTKKKEDEGLGLKFYSCIMDLLLWRRV
jgi:hypothetical protein